MSAFTLVYRALPFSLPWKRRPSTSVTSNKGKEKEAEVQLEESDYISPPKIQHCLPNVEIPDLPAHRDISHDLHIAVKQRLDQKTTRNDAQSDDSEAGYASDSDSDSHSDCKTHHLAEKCEISARPRLARVVSWASIVRSQCRWTSDQEKKLEDAERQLARCQKAWSSEQELWLAYVQALSDEKEAHSEFMLLRTRQQDEEQLQFRKAWKRRRSLENTLRLSSPAVKSNNGMSIRFRRLQRHGYLATPLVASDSPVLECKG
ncbi:uncharacterized protein N7469_004275 [Penicillium citrinum]|uniref:Uncharacterized protein n=1 Tax=Penicillium citrinum TaxID=5077 RepID=A0A9W9P6T9_PENCI|nr:uncharacterized protein N7469_004275 [Penicillium citrinum]KAJ5235107.1 hypothetical protein N7469_004275 [Penicillium citrinum]